MERRYEERVVLVTGASSGLGQAIALRLAAEGAFVVLAARREAELRGVVESITAAGGQAEYVACDLSDEAARVQLARYVKDRFGRLDLLVNNAGREQFSPLQATSTKVIREVIDLNFLALADLTRCCLGLLKAGSAIVNISSASAMQGTAGMTVYSATKGAILSFTRSLARELASRKVRVNAVAPGQVRTAMLERSLGKLRPEQRTSLEAAHPLGFGEPEDVAAAVVFLGSNEAKWITGQTLVVDGGLTA